MNEYPNTHKYTLVFNFMAAVDIKKWDVVNKSLGNYNNVQKSIPEMQSVSESFFLNHGLIAISMLF